MYLLTTCTSYGLYVIKYLGIHQFVMSTHLHYDVAYPAKTKDSGRYLLLSYLTNILLCDTLVQFNFNDPTLYTYPHAFCSQENFTPKAADVFSL